MTLSKIGAGAVTNLRVILHLEFLLFGLFELVTEVEFGGLLLKLGELVLVLGHLLQSGLDAVKLGKRCRLISHPVNCALLTICLGGH